MPSPRHSRSQKRERATWHHTHTTSHQPFTLTPHLTLPSSYRVDVAGQTDARVHPKRVADASGLFGHLEELHHPSTATDHKRASTGALERAPAEDAHEAVVHARAGGVHLARGEVQDSKLQGTAPSKRCGEESLRRSQGYPHHTELCTRKLPKETVRKCARSIGPHPRLQRVLFHTRVLCLHVRHITWSLALGQRGRRLALR